MAETSRLDGLMVRGYRLSIGLMVRGYRLVIVIVIVVICYMLVADVVLTRATA